jgi:hypothetical protein
MSDESDTTGAEPKTADAATDPLKVEATEDLPRQDPAGSKRKVKTESGISGKKKSRRCSTTASGTRNRLSPEPAIWPDDRAKSSSRYF